MLCCFAAALFFVVSAQYDYIDHAPYFNYRYHQPRILRYGQVQPYSYYVNPPPQQYYVRSTSERRPRVYRHHESRPSSFDQSSNGNRTINTTRYSKRTVNITTTRRMTSSRGIPRGRVVNNATDRRLTATKMPQVRTLQRDNYHNHSMITSYPSTKAQVLLPTLDQSGKPPCLKSPMDTFCEYVTNYPKIDFRNEIGFNENEFRDIFSDHIKEEDGPMGKSPGAPVYTDDELGEERVCGRKMRLIFPKVAKNQENKWVYVVNDQSYIQGVVSEVCINDGKPCAYLENNLPPGMSSRCVQKYSTKRLLALSATEKTYVDKFKFPSCCACYVKSPIGRNLPIPPKTRKSSREHRQSDRSSNKVKPENSEPQAFSSSVIHFPNDEDPRMRNERMHRNRVRYRSSRTRSDLDTSGRPTCVASPTDTFCENVSNYPQVDLRNEIRLDEFESIFGDKDEDILSRKSYTDDDLGEERVCKRRQRVIYPKMARNIDNKWVYVVNDETYTQAVVSEICEEEGKACNYYENNLPPGLRSHCVQKYSSKRLLALSGDKKTYVDKFEFPSCCACYVKTPFGN